MRREAFCRAIRAPLAGAVACGDLDSERDLYGRPGRYRRTLDSTAVGGSCPACGMPIEKVRLLGNASYFCPKCQT